MRCRFYSLLTLLLLIGPLFPIQVSSVEVSGTHNGDNIEVSNDNIEIRVTGGQNVPKFEFWKPDSDNRYSVQFSQMFEAIDENDNNEYDFQSEKSVSQTKTALSSWGWSFSEMEQNDGETTFTIASTSAQANTGDFSIEFVNHLGDNAESFKFDVKVDNYEFESPDEDAMLVLAFRLRGPRNEVPSTQSAGGGSTTTEAANTEVREPNDNRANFGNGFLDIEDTAQTSEGDIDVGLSTGSDGSPIAFIAYSRFDNSFDHDPTLGFRTLIFGIPANIFFIIAGVIILVPVIYKTSRKNN